MSNYTKTTNFATKDSLPSGNANKIVKGTEIDTEFNNIATAVATKADTAGPTFTGTVTIPTADINGGAVDGTTIGAASASSIIGTTIVANTSISIAGDGATVTGIKDEDDMSSNSATKLATQQSIKAYVDSQVTAQDLDVTDGSSSIDIDLDSESLGILGGTGIDSTASGTGVTLAIDSTVTTLTGSQTLTNKTLTAPTLTGTTVVASLDISGDVDVDGTLETDALSINGTTVTSTAAELNILDGVTSTAAELNILDGVTSTTAELNILDGVTSTAAELNILDGKAFLDEDDMSSNSATGIASQQSIKAYVDAQITAEDLDFQADSGGALSIDLDSETLTFTGGTGIDTSGSGNAVTFAIDSTVATLTGSQTLTNKSLTAPTLTGTAVVASLDISGDIDVDGTTNLDVVDIDGAVDMASTLQVDGAITSSAGATITLADNTDNLTLISTDTDDNSGPNLRMYRNSSSPGDNYVLGQIDFEGKNDATQDVRYGFISAKISDASDGTEDGQLRFFTIANGTETQTMTLESGNATFTGAVTIDPADGVADDAYALTVRNNEATDGRNYGLWVRAGSNSSDESFSVRNHDNSATYFKVRGDGNVGIGTSSITSGFKLEVTGDARFGDAVGDDAVELGWSSGGSQGFIQAYDRGASAFRDLSINNAITVTSSGDVGIGVAPTFTPGGSRRLLQVTNGSSGGQIALSNDSNEAENPRIFADADNLGFATATTGGGVMQFYTAGSEAARITSSRALLVGKTASGIGNTGLEVFSTGQTYITRAGGPLALNNTSGVGGEIYLYAGGTYTANISTVSGGISFGTGAGGSVTDNRVVIDSSGTLRINNTRTTATKLHVVGGTASGTMYDTAVFAGGQNSTSGSGARIYLSGCENDPISRGAVIQGEATDNSNGHALIFKTSAASSAPSEAARFDSSGNLLAGTSNTTWQSQEGLRYFNGGSLILTRDSDEPLNINRLSSDGNLAVFYKNASALGTIATNAGAFVMKGLSTSAPVQLQTHDGNEDIEVDPDGFIKFETAGSEAMRIDSSQNLLVGTTNANPTSSSVNDAGVELSDTGGVRSTVASNPAATFNRKTDDGDIALFRKNGGSVAVIGVNNGDNAYIGATASGHGGFYFGNTNVAPMAAGTRADDTVDLGTSSHRWDDIYASNGTIQTSDRNEKQDIEALSDAEQRVAVAAKGLLRKFRWKSAVEEKGDDARIHFGIIAQDLQDAFTAEGLDAGRYAMFISSTWTDEETGEERTRLGVRYSELLAFIISAI